MKIGLTKDLRIHAYLDELKAHGIDPDKRYEANATVDGYIYIQESHSGNKWSKDSDKRRRLVFRRSKVSFLPSDLIIKDALPVTNSYRGIGDMFYIKIPYETTTEKMVRETGYKSKLDPAAQFEHMQSFKHNHITEPLIGADHYRDNAANMMKEEVAQFNRGSEQRREMTHEEIRQFMRDSRNVSPMTDDQWEKKTNEVLGIGEKDKKRAIVFGVVMVCFVAAFLYLHLT